MNVVDSSGWIEWFNGGPNAPAFRVPILDLARLLVRSIVVLEVYRRALQSVSAARATELVTVLSVGRIVPLDRELALAAGETGVRLKLAMADSIVYATAQKFGATVWTQDADFDGLPNVRYFPKQ